MTTLLDQEEEQEYHHQLSRRMRLLVNIVKLYPIVMNLYILFVVLGMLILKMEDPSLYIYTFTGQSFIINILLFQLSKVLNFCNWHRCLIISMSACLLFETLNNYGLKLNYYIYGKDVNLYIYIFGIITLAGLILAAVKQYKRGRIKQKSSFNI